jgi:hypothetical protein
MLTQVESLRFQRAMYQFWLFQNTFLPDPGVDGVDEYEDEDDDDDEPSTESKARMQYLNTYTSQELLEINSIITFLDQTILWFMTARDWSGLGATGCLQPSFRVDN